MRGLFKTYYDIIPPKWILRNYRHVYFSCKNAQYKKKKHSGPRKMLKITYVDRVNLKFRIKRAKILSIVLYGHVTWFLTLRDEYKLKAFQNRELRRIFGRKGEEKSGRMERTTQRGAS
jgi:hypothetical protein